MTVRELKEKLEELDDYDNVYIELPASGNEWPIASRRLLLTKVGSRAVDIYGNTKEIVVLS